MSLSINSGSERPSLLGAKSVLTGDFATTEELVILGQLVGGKVRSPNITVGPAAHVTAEIHADTIRIEGIVIGDVYATVSIVVQSSATVQGRVHCPQITIHDGAMVNGAINLSAAASRAHPKTARAVR